MSLDALFDSHCHIQDKPSTAEKSRRVSVFALQVSLFFLSHFIEIESIYFFLKKKYQIDLIQNELNKKQATHQGDWPATLALARRLGRRALPG